MIRRVNSAMAVAIFAIIFADIAPLQAGAQNRSPGRLLPHGRVYARPSNLMVLPKNLTGHEVFTIMKQWNVELGVRCGACHFSESDSIVPGGRPYPRFEDDSKPMKRVARTMFTMTVDINRKFITGGDGVPGPVTCGTCHRGNIRPEPFNSSAENPETAFGASAQDRAPVSR